MENESIIVLEASRNEASKSTNSRTKSPFSVAENNLVQGRKINSRREHGGLGQGGGRISRMSGDLITAMPQYQGKIVHTIGEGKVRRSRRSWGLDRVNKAASRDALSMPL